MPQRQGKRGVYGVHMFHTVPEVHTVLLESVIGCRFIWYPKQHQGLGLEGRLAGCMCISTVRIPGTCKR